MTQQPWYIDWFNSPYYYQLYSNRNESEIETFVPNLINYLNPEPGSRMLDVACGRGRFSKILAALGFDVTGTDISKSAIAFARQFESENLHFYSHDLRLPFWINYFDYVFNFFTSFGYFRTRREHEDAIRTVCKSLNNTGTLVIDYLNVYYSEKRLVPTEKKALNGVTYNIQRWVDETHFYKKISIEDPALSHTEEFIEKVARFTLGDFIDMLSYQGMQVNTVFGDYQLNSYDIKNSPRMIIVAKKIR
ncbi:MAG: class I SAM-dependent methyltransferase [Bacteroidetes bacterium]|nr:class I SAM-dependent methyltransferase [Bacteroidota bacterium]MBS1631626.1 class I SAM-dependent methyltransferase [Bacteroidota bacterium]